MVLDASAAIELLLNTVRGRRLAARLEDESDVVHVPHLIDVEISHVLRRFVLRGVLEARRGAVAIHHWRSFDVERYAHEPLLERVWSLRENLGAYDAVYVALAEALAAVVVTGDRKLAGAPGLAIRVELI